MYDSFDGNFYALVRVPTHQHLCIISLRQQYFVQLTTYGPRLGIELIHFRLKLKTFPTQLPLFQVFLTGRRNF